MERMPTSLDNKTTKRCQISWLRREKRARSRTILEPPQFTSRAAAGNGFLDDDGEHSMTPTAVLVHLGPAGRPLAASLDQQLPHLHN